MTAVLIACAHGTRFEEGRVVVRELLEVLRSTAPAGVEVLEAYVDVHGPYVSDVVAAARERTDDIVIVPLLLSTGYHTEVDLVEAAAASRSRPRSDPTRCWPRSSPIACARPGPLPTTPSCSPRPDPPARAPWSTSNAWRS